MIQLNRRLAFGSPEKPPHSLYLSDNLDSLRTLPSDSFDLLYADPPFFTQRQQRGEQELNFDDRWESLEAFVAWLSPRLIEFRRVLSPKGSLYIHLDWRVVHYIKVALDRIFGWDQFRNEIIWKYQMAGRGARYFARKHDTLLFYSKTNEYFFDASAVREPYTPHARDKHQKRYGGRMGTDEDGRQYVEKLGTGGKRRYRYYLDQGKLASDVWELESLHPSAKERSGYPTQKPIELISRVLGASCPKGGLFGDFFLGSGTSLLAATQHGARFCGGDVSEQAITHAIERYQTVESERPDLLLYQEDPCPTPAPPRR
jgi:site-specific DNA-methyltransferase (adenine-specific)